MFLITLGNISVRQGLAECSGDVVQWRRLQCTHEGYAQVPRHHTKD